ncbi:MAG: MOSC domain-containing protein [Gammaproteobacteria bacterium]|nr:MAG: MOSC domain-containing protein [Gammaproteobacteria bacterium]RLA15698.1 MAG: MOSC domain-containing protein [Gammaproteobacteria bacterium]
MKVTVDGLFNYPVKSLRARSQQQLTLDAAGLQGDRRWMIVDDKGGFITQRQCPKMATLSAMPVADGLKLENLAGEVIAVRIPGAGAPALTVQVWQDSCLAKSAGEEVDRWLSDYLGQSCHLVYMPEDCRRLVNGFMNNLVGFADGYPLLLTSTASLDELNRRLSKKGADAVPMSRFRPNLVVEGGELLEAFAEDGWAALTIDGLRLVNAKPCGRCMVITTDQLTGEKHRRREPLTTLREFRIDAEGEILFGINLVPEFSGLQQSQAIKLGDWLQVHLS